MKLRKLSAIMMAAVVATSTPAGAVLGQITAYADSDKDKSKDYNIGGADWDVQEDANGKIQTVSKDFTATAEEYSDPWGGMDPGMEEPMPDEPQQTGLPVWGWVLIVLGGAAVVVVIVVVVRKRKKAKALANLEAEDNDEDI